MQRYLSVDYITVGNSIQNLGRNKHSLSNRCSKGMFARDKMVVFRNLTLTLEEIKNVSSIKCELSN